MNTQVQRRGAVADSARAMHASAPRLLSNGPSGAATAPAHIAPASHVRRTGTATRAVAYKAPADFVTSKEQYLDMYRQSIADPDAFWGALAEQFHWQQKWQPNHISYNMDVRKGKACRCHRQAHSYFIPRLPQCSLHACFACHLRHPSRVFAPLQASYR